MARQTGSKPTAPPPRAFLFVTQNPPPPPGLTAEEILAWDSLHDFRNIVDAIRDHLQPPGTRRPHLNTLTWLYYNHYIAGTGQGYMNERSLFSRYSRDFRAEENLHLATIGSGRETTAMATLERWNWYLRARGLPAVRRVGTGLPGALRHRDGAAAAILLSFSSAAATPVDPATAAETAGVGAVTSGQIGPYTAASEATTTLVAVVQNAATRRAQVENTIRSVTEEGDRDLFLALQYHLDLLPTQAPETNRDAIIRLAVQFLGSKPRANVRGAVFALARANWNLEVALESWVPDDGDGDGNEDEGRRPQKRRRFDDDDDNDGQERDGGRDKGKGKQRAD